MPPPGETMLKEGSLLLKVNNINARQTPAPANAAPPRSVTRLAMKLCSGAGNSGRVEDFLTLNLREDAREKNAIAIIPPKKTTRFYTSPFSGKGELFRSVPFGGNQGQNPTYSPPHPRPRHRERPAGLFQPDQHLAHKPRHY